MDINSVYHGRKRDEENLLEETDVYAHVTDVKAEDRMVC